MTAGAAVGVAVESGEGEPRPESLGGAGIAAGASAAAMVESGGAWSIERMASKATRTGSTIGCSGSPMNDGAASAARATIAGASTVAVHTLRRRAGVLAPPRTAVTAVGTMMRVAMRIGSAGRIDGGIRIGSAARINDAVRTGSAARVDGAIRVSGVTGDAAPSVVAARASTQP